MTYLSKSVKTFAAAPIIFMVLFSMPANLSFAQEAKDLSEKEKNGSGIILKNVNSIVVDKSNIKWFSTEKGIVSFDGKTWKAHKDFQNIPTQNLQGLTYVADAEGQELWISSPEGATLTRLPMDEHTESITYNTENASLTSQNVMDVAAGMDSTRWIGTDKGVFALSKDKWLKPDYAMYYTERMFSEYPITSMATNLKGDTLFIATEGIGIARVYRDNLDGISGASVYAQWGPIELPSDYVLSIFIAPDGTKWFGTEEGAARHRGNNTLDNWTAFTTDDGLVDNFVQTICSDMDGNIWFGTSGGISVLSGSSWTSYTIENGLISNNILSLATDLKGVVWIGTDEGISSFEKGKFTSY
jgi:ligand-binding sensor domain-containing protein